ncbi:Acetyltransferase (GNAT) domain protein [anaerobic digester metagenome]
MIETERLILRSINKDDAADIFEYSKEPEVGKNAGWKPHETIEETREILNAVFLEKDGIFGLVEKESGKLFGTIGLVPDVTRENEGSRMLGYAIGKNFWGKGYMTEAVGAILSYAFDEKGYGLISVSHYTDNLRSQRVIEKSGFQFEGVQRQSELRYDGVMKDKRWYSMTKDEFCRKIK